jgi:hypothetical protein
MDFIPPEIFLGLNRPSTIPIPVKSDNSYSGSIEENYEEQKKEPSDGSATLNGHKYIVGNGFASVDDEKLNSPTLGIKNNQVYFFDVNNKSWTMLNGTDVEKVIVESIKKKYEPKPQPNSVEALQLNQSSPFIKQINQINPDNRAVDTSQLTEQKFPNRVTLFEDNFAIIGLGLLGMGIWMLINKEK